MNLTHKTDWQGWGIAALRMMVGVTFLMHGGQKLFVYGIGGTAGFMAHIGIPAPTISAVLTIGAELLGGALLLLGLFTRYAAAVLAFTMMVAVVSVHLRNGFFLPNGYEYALMMLVANIALALTGAGEFALERVVWRSRGEEQLDDKLAVA
jgi:putative oxidoreductase